MAPTTRGGDFKTGDHKWDRRIYRREWDVSVKSEACLEPLLAEGCGDDQGFNLGIEGDNEGTVQVASTRLIGARDFAVLRVSHSAINNDPTAWECMLRFLREGYFVFEEARQPIEE
jgi:hypothetical protein